MAFRRHLRRFSIVSGIFILLILLKNNPITQSKNTIPNDFREASAKQSSSSKKQLKNSSQILENYYAAKLDAMGIRLRPGTAYRKDSKPTPVSSKKCKSLVYRTLMKLPFSHRNQITELTLFYTNDGRRGFGGDGAIILRCMNVADSELASILTHEVGHLVDGALLFGTDKTNESGFYDFETPVSVDDKSLNFYKISWVSESQKKENADELDFVSLYAMTDPFEDFAETYAYYRLHGAEFRELFESSAALAQKYEFMKNYVFGGEEFNTGKYPLDIDIWERRYDVTVIPFSIKKFFLS